MQMNVVQAVLMVNLNVAMDLVSMSHGHVMDMVIVQTAQMKMKISVVRFLMNVLMTIVQKVLILMAGLAIHVITVYIVMMIVIAILRTIAVVPVVAQQIQNLTAL
jgi:hypothetical protein